MISLSLLVPHKEDSLRAPAPDSRLARASHVEIVEQRVAEGS